MVGVITISWIDAVVLILIALLVFCVVVIVLFNKILDAIERQKARFRKWRNKDNDEEDGE